MGCLIVLLVVAGIFTFPFGLIFWAFAAILVMMQNNQRQQSASNATAERIALLSAPPEVQAQIRAERDEAERKRVRNVWIGMGVVLVFLVFLLVSGSMSKKASTTTSSTPFVPESTATPATVESTPTPTPEVRRAEAVVTPAPTSTVEVGYIPDPTDQQATAAFNDLQDQFHRPHAKKVIYDAATDSYHWIGPKTGKKMSMKRSQFDAEIWNAYYKKLKGVASNPVPSNGERNQTCTLEKTIYVTASPQDAKMLEMLDDSDRAAMIGRGQARAIFEGSKITLNSDEDSDGVDQLRYDNQTWYVLHSVMEQSIVN